jgi:hypothetical protein
MSLGWSFFLDYLGFLNLLSCRALYELLAVIMQFGMLPHYAHLKVHSVARRHHVESTVPQGAFCNAELISFVVSGHFPLRLISNDQA